MEKYNKFWGHDLYDKLKNSMWLCQIAKPVLRDVTNIILKAHNVFHYVLFD